jgi:hypothetical protein
MAADARLDGVPHAQFFSYAVPLVAVGILTPRQYHSNLITFVIACVLGYMLVRRFRCLPPCLRACTFVV